MSEITLDRLRIVRNSIVREWQQMKEASEKLPENAFSKKGLRREMSGLRMALEELHGEFPELDRIPMDQKPRCPFCQEEMEHPALADHMQEHMKAGDHILMPNPDADLHTGVDSFAAMMKREMEFVGWDGEAKKLLENMAEKFDEIVLRKAGGAGDAVHPPTDPDSEEKP